MNAAFRTSAATLLFPVALYCNAAGPGLWPTDVGYTGECAGATVTAPKSPLVRELEQKQCNDDYKDDPSEAKNCLRYKSRVKRVEFFTDRCGDGKTYFVSVNGEEETLTRVNGADHEDPPYIGSYRGPTLRVTIGNPRKIKTRYEDERRKKFPIGAIYSVTVIIERGRQREEFVGEISTGL